MRHNTLSQPSTLRHEGIVEMLPGEHPNGSKRCRLHLGNWSVGGWTWLDLDPGLNHLFRGRLTFLDVDRDPRDTLLLGFEPDYNLPLERLLSSELCPIGHVVPRTARLIDAMTIAPLRRFVTDALMRRDVFRVYWTCPASRQDHHAYPGGLAEHCMEIATMVSTVATLDRERRELGIALALLHDYGKMWCYRNDGHNIASSRHEAYGLEQLRPGLDALQAEAPEIGAVMEELLGGRRAARKSAYQLAIGSVVKAYDQLSCERTRCAKSA